MNPRRYPGIRPFETAESHLFFGRDRDVHDLHVLASLEKLVVLFGKSGYGKSSLINAGLLPLLAGQERPDADRPLPVMVRFGSFSAGANRTPVDMLLGRLQEILPHEGPHFLDDLAPERPLWYHFKKRQHTSSNTPSASKNRCYLLIFDQFEEFFTYPIAQQETLKTQLAELVYTEIPQAVRTRSANLDKPQRQLLAEALDVRVLFSIRADRINLLHSFGVRFPAILDKRNRYELRGLSADQAEAAVTGPAGQAGNFSSPNFSYSSAALRTIAERLGETRQSDEPAGIETFQLQVLCEYLESEIIAGRIPGNRIEPEHFAGKIDAIYEGYYLRLLDRLSPEKARAAQRLIEESLLFEDERSGEARRLSVDADVLAQRYAAEGVTKETLGELENAFLLRRESNSVGGFNFEISHDTLISPILRLKNERLAREAAARERAQTRRRQRRLTALLLLFLGIVALSTAAIGYVLRLKNAAEHNLVIAQENETKARQALEQANRSQRLAESERSRAEENFQEARNAQLKTEMALDDLGEAHIEIANRLLSDAENLLQGLRYTQAQQRLDQLQRFAASAPENILYQNPPLFQKWETLLLEVVFLKNESGRPDSAMLALQTLLKLKNLSPEQRQQLDRLSALPESARRQPLNALLRRINPTALRRFQERYYPPLIAIEGGVFQMGRDTGESDEIPAHPVRVDDYQLGRTEVTVWQYNLYMQANGRDIFSDPATPLPGWDWEGGNPMVWMHFYDAIQYANWLSRQLGLEEVYTIDKTRIDTANLYPEDKAKWTILRNPEANGFRLPTEAEWEYAARGGKNRSPFLFAGNDDADAVGWHEANGNSRTHAAGSKQANALGLYDMSGNVWEWCWDWYDQFPTDGQMRINPLGAAQSKGRVIRGGSWYSYQKDINVFNRRGDGPGNRRTACGFRLARNRPANN